MKDMFQFVRQDRLAMAAGTVGAFVFTFLWLFMAPLLVAAAQIFGAFVLLIMVVVVLHSFKVEYDNTGKVDIRNFFGYQHPPEDNDGVLTDGGTAGKQQQQGG